MPERTWTEIRDEQGQAVRWDMLLDGAPLEGAYVSLVEKGSYEVHFPRLVPAIVPSLPVAMKTLESAPLAKRKGIAIGRQAQQTDKSAFSSIDETAAALGTSRSRVNAMVANGVLAAARFEGEVMVSRSSIEHYSGIEQKPGAKGRFANKFVQYFPDRESDAFYLLEVDASDESQMADAAGFVGCVRENERHPGGARLVGYRTAMKLRNSKCCVQGDGESPIASFAEFSVEEHLARYETSDPGRV